MQLLATFGAIPVRALHSPVTLGTGVSHIQGRLPRLRELAKLRLRAHWEGKLTARWLSVLNSDPFLAQLALIAPQLLHKVYRPYLTNTWCQERRLHALEQHYRFIIAAGLKDLVLQAAGGGVLLSGFSGKCGTPYEIWLRAVAPMEREGELVLQLRTGGELVYALAFSFLETLGEHAIGIGCLQGSKGEAAREMVRAGTRALHGLRPKNLLIGLVRQIGHDLGCSHVHLVGNANRVVHSAIAQGKVLADYDQAWTELGAIRRLDGDYQLQCRSLAEPEFGMVESKRRSELRKRHALCGEVHAAVSASLQRS